jgi:hypothetical protein
LVILTRRRFDRLVLDATKEGYDIGYQFAKTTFDGLPKRGGQAGSGPVVPVDKAYEGISCHGQSSAAPGQNKVKTKKAKKDKR